MIFVAAGTQDGRELAAFLNKNGFRVTVSVVSQYGSDLLKEHQGFVVNDRPLDEEQLVAFLSRHGIKVFVDAGHPYAANMHRNAIAACKALNIPYIRYERADSSVSYDRLFSVADYEAAAKCAGGLGKNVFLTTGSRSLPVFVNSPYLKGCNLTVRVLPTTEVLAECEALGLSPKNIVAMQGPFSQGLNEEMFRQTGAEVIVTKNSGKIGGTDTKLAAAMAMGLNVVMIERPKIDYGHVVQDFASILEFVRYIDT